MSSEIHLGGLEIRPHEHAVLVHGNEVPLTSREYDILFRLAEHPAWVLSADTLSGDTEDDYSSESVSVLVSRLRQKLAAAGASNVVETIRGAGYRLRPSAVPSDEPAAATVVGNELRDAFWQLQEAVMEVEHSGSPERRRGAIDALEQALRAVDADLAE